MVKAFSKSYSVISFVLVLAILFSCTFLNLPKARAEETDIYDFEDMSAFEYPWSTSGKVSVSQDPQNAENNCLLVDDSTSAAMYADLAFVQTSDDYLYSFKVMAAEVGNCAISLFANDSGSSQVTINLKPDGSLNYYNGASLVKLGNYELNKWMSVEIIAHPDTETFDLTIDGTEIGTGLAFRTAGKGYGYVGGMRIGTGSSTTAKVYVDDVCVPILQFVSIEKFVPEYKKVETLSNTPADAEYQYHCFPTMQRVSDSEVLIVYRRGEKHAWSHGLLETILYDTVEQKVISRSVLDDTEGINDQNPELIRMPNGDLVVYCDQQTEADTTERLGIATFLSTDNGKSWTKNTDGLIDDLGIEYGYVFDYSIVDNELYLLAMTFPQLAHQGHERSVHIIKTADNGKNWTHIVNLDTEFNFDFNESSIEYYNGGFLVIARGDSKLTKALVTDINGNRITDRNLSIEFDCIDNIARPHMFVEDGKYYLLCRNIPANSGNKMELILYEFDPETLSFKTHVELEPGNTGDNGGDGFYAEYYMQERDGIKYFNVVTYSKAYTNNYKPSIIKLEYVWDELRTQGIDTIVPTISGVEDGKTYYVTQKVDVKDTYLSEVTLNGENVTQTTFIEAAETTVTLNFEKSEYDYATLANGVGRGTTGVVSATSADTTLARIYVRPEGENGSGAIKWAGSGMDCGIMLGSSDVAANATANACTLKHLTDYSATLKIKHTSGEKITVKLVGTKDETSTSGYEFYSKTLETPNDEWTNLDLSFTTPSKETLGKNKYLSVIIEKGEVAETFVLLLDSVKITEKTDESYLVNKLQSHILAGDIDKSYTISATDESGNKKTVSITMKPISSIIEATKNLTVENVTAADREAVVTARETLLSIDTSNATDQEKTLVKELTRKHSKLLVTIDGVECVTHTFDNACDDDCNVCGEVRNVDGHKYDNVFDADCNECGSRREAMKFDKESGVYRSSIRYESGKGETYKSAGVRFGAKLEKKIANVASEIGFVIVPKGYSVDSALAVKAVNKNNDKHIIYSENEEYIDYQVIMTGLTRENDKINLLKVSINVYFYCVIDGETFYFGQIYNDSYNEILKRLNGVSDDESFIDSKENWWDLV